MPLYSIVNISAGQVVPQRGQTSDVFMSLAKVDIPDLAGTTLYGANAGHQVGSFKLYGVTVLVTGSGPVESVGAAVYDPILDRVTQTTTRSDFTLTGNALAAAVNAEADRRLVNAYPISEQVWGSLRGVRLVHKLATGSTLTGGEQTTLTAISTAADFVNALRASRIALISSSAANMATITASSNWP